VKVDLGAQHVGNLDRIQLQEIALHEASASTPLSVCLRKTSLATFVLRPNTGTVLSGSGGAGGTIVAGVLAGAFGASVAAVAAPAVGAIGAAGFGWQVGVEVEAVELQGRRRGHRRSEAHEAAAGHALAVEID